MFLVESNIINRPEGLDLTQNGGFFQISYTFDGMVLVQAHRIGEPFAEIYALDNARFRTAKVVYPEVIDPFGASERYLICVVQQNVMLNIQSIEGGQVKISWKGVRSLTENNNFPKLMLCYRKPPHRGRPICLL